MTKSGHLSWYFLVRSLKLSILVIYPLKKNMVTKIFGLLVTNLSFVLVMGNKPLFALIK